MSAPLPAWADAVAGGATGSGTDRMLRSVCRLCALGSLALTGAVAGLTLRGVVSSGGGVAAGAAGGLLLGTALTAAVALAVAAPLGVLGAIYLHELAPRRVRLGIRALLRMVVAVPAVVYGGLALLLVAPMLQGVWPGLAPQSALGPGLVMGVMLAPVVLFFSEKALASVPASLRESALALGAGRLVILRRIVLPAAAPGLLAALLFALARATGETLIVALAAGLTPAQGVDLLAPAQTAAAGLLHTAQGLGETAPGAVMVAAGVLFAFTALVNLAGEQMLRRRRAEGVS